MSAKNNIEKVAEFHAVGGHPVAECPTIISLERAKMRASWMLEEIQEFIDAVKAANMEGAIDALADLEYFTHGTAVEMGVGSIMPEVFNRVHTANMSKFCSTVEEAEASVLQYAKNDEEVTYEKVGDYYVLYWAAGPKKGKIAKAAKWREPRHADLIRRAVNASNIPNI